ncbi:uncharacterized protein [Maniola hyperantus]|uniref:uncharacterized protein n=1 Tax=Aphantopus hyperantus TaxID=2795564 RepID=UPI00374A0B80
MFVTVVVFYLLTKVSAQDQSLRAVTPQSPLVPFIDLFTGASSYSSEPIRRTYSDGYYHASCSKPDTLASFANVLGSVAKIMVSAAVIALLKILGGKLLFLPITVMVLAKMGLKAILLWPLISKLMRYLRKKKNKARVIMDCSERLACVLQRSSDSGWGSNFGSALTFFMIDDVDEDGFVAKTLLSILAGEKVAECMSLDCNSGSDIS